MNITITGSPRVYGVHPEYSDFILNKIDKEVSSEKIMLSIVVDYRIIS